MIDTSAGSSAAASTDDNDDAPPDLEEVDEEQRKKEAELLLPDLSNHLRPILPMSPSCGIFRSFPKKSKLNCPRAKGSHL